MMQDDFEALAAAWADFKRIVIATVRANWPMLVFVYLAAVALQVVWQVMVP